MVVVVVVVVTKTEVEAGVGKKRSRRARKSDTVKNGMARRIVSAVLLQQPDHHDSADHQNSLSRQAGWRVQQLHTTDTELRGLSLLLCITFVFVLVVFAELFLPRGLDQRTETSAA